MDTHTNCVYIIRCDDFITQHTWLQLIMWEELDCSVTGDNGINMLMTENICITYCLMSKEVTLMFPDSVRSLLVRNPFSHALFVATSQVRFLIHKEHGIGWRTATDKKRRIFRLDPNRISSSSNPTLTTFSLNRKTKSEANYSCSEVQTASLGQWLFQDMMLDPSIVSLYNRDAPFNRIKSRDGHSGCGIAL